MAKKKKNYRNGFIASAISVVLGIVAIVMLFLPAIAIKDTETTYSGLQIVFGYKEKTIFKDVVYFEFSFMNLLTYLLAIGGVVFAILGVMGKGSKFASFIALALFVLSAIFFFLQVAFCVPNKDLESIISGLSGASLKDSLTLAVGSIIGGICSIICALASAYNVFQK